MHLLPRTSPHPVLSKPMQKVASAMGLERRCGAGLSVGILGFLHSPGSWDWHVVGSFHIRDALRQCTPFTLGCFSSSNTSLLELDSQKANLCPGSSKSHRCILLFLPCKVLPVLGSGGRSRWGRGNSVFFINSYPYTGHPSLIPECTVSPSSLPAPQSRANLRIRLGHRLFFPWSFLIFWKKLHYKKDKILIALRKLFS